MRDYSLSDAPNKKIILELIHLENSQVTRATDKMGWGRTGKLDTVLIDLAKTNPFIQH